MIIDQNTESTKVFNAQLSSYGGKDLFKGEDGDIYEHDRKRKYKGLFSNIMKIKHISLILHKE